MFLNVLLLFLMGCQSAATRSDPIPWANGIEILRSQSQVRVPAIALLRSGWLEQAVCTPETRTHESVFAILAAPSELHAALLVVGGVPGTPGAPASLDSPARPPEGSLLHITMDLDGSVHRLQDLIVDDRSGDSLQGNFVFAGSKMVEWNGAIRYLADDEGSAVGLVTFGDELVGYSEPRSASIEHARAIFRPNGLLLPPPGTEVVLIFTVCPEDEG